MSCSVAVLGTGYMGGGIAQIFGLTGHRVALLDISVETAEANRRRLLREAADYASAGLFPADAVARLDRSLWVAAGIAEAVADARFVLEAVPEDRDLKRATLDAASRAAAAETILATNTSTIAIADLAGAVVEPGRFLGTHFVNPAPFVPGVEVIPHAGTSEGIVAATKALLQEVGKVPIVIKDATGFVVPRLQFALFSEAARIVEEGIASPADVDALVRTTFGIRLPFFGPFATADMAGLDVYAACYRVLQEGFPGRFETPRLLSELVAAGRLGTKSGAGFFEADGDRDALALYRNRAFVALQRLVEELGPPPIG
jgi:3-hydroxybutyryl-CoA dehydrogenase